MVKVSHSVSRDLFHHCLLDFLNKYRVWLADNNSLGKNLNYFSRSSFRSSQFIVMPA